MNRRGFLAMLAGAVLDPERLLWRRGAKLISIPKKKIGDPITVRRPARYCAIDLGVEPSYTVIAERWKRATDGAIYRTLTAEGQSEPYSIERWPGKEMPIMLVHLAPDPIPYIPDAISFTQMMSKEEFRRRYPR